ncbi:MAG: zinc ribbon domain-containing protein [Acidobacteriales bacterium]|nr:zinc ribbon domain-containing protein [Terriglobales bacterium]
MAFCANCGSSLDAGAKFCAKCGTAATLAPVKAVAPSTTTLPSTAENPQINVPAPSSGGDTAVGITFGILATLVLLGLLAAGSCVYLAYRVKNGAKEFAHRVGADAPPYTGSRQPCAKLLTDEAGSALGQPVKSVEQRGQATCIYHFGPAGGQQLAIEYSWQGGIMAMRLSHAAMKQVSGMETMQPIPNLGDEAYAGPMNSNLMMRKGDVMVTFDLRANGVSIDAAKQMAGKIAGRL